MIVFIFGAIIGSFLNMLIYRLPLKLSLINPKRSICPSCNSNIKWYENIPIVSYILLKGQCSNCDSKISIFYPIVEVVTAVITYLLYLKYSIGYDFFIFVSLFYILIVLSFIDFRYKAVPDYLLILSLIVVFFVSDFNFSTALMFAGGFVLLELFLTYYIQNIKSKITKDESLKEQRAMGEGDIPIIAIIGGVLDVKLALIAIFLSAVFAMLPALFNIYIKKDIETPFIPYLTLSLFVVLIYNEYLINILNSMVNL
ncbi:MAG: prepilin peptidase [Campylobacterota bacterium]|nr:prepilin peptidase [Campylobacterota bacterium]